MATIHKLFKSPFFDFEFLRLLAMAPHEGAEIGEVLEAAAKIKDQDPESWYSTLLETGSKAEAIAKEAEASGDRVGARRAYLRSSNYLRAAQFMLNEGPIGQDQRVLPTIERAIANFRKGVQYRDGKTIFLEIPYEGGKTLPGYLYLPPASRRIPGRKIPILLNSGGGDSTQEEIYFVNPAYGPDLGYAVLTFEGPGQGIVLRRDKLPMRPDWESVTGPVLDHLFELATRHPELELDLDHIAVTGASMGGYFALRAAADPRIKACVSVDGFYSLSSFVGGRMPGPLFKGFMSGWLSDWMFNGILSVLKRLEFQARWEFNHLQWATGSKTDADVMRSFGAYTLQNADGTEYLADVKCPTLVTGAGASFYFNPATTTDKIYECLTSLKDGVDKEKWIATDVAYGGLQAKIGAFGYSAQKTFEWLDQRFEIEREHLTASSRLEDLVSSL
ncbi:hydrolase psoB [Aspergillus novofumigatus IBT 16806]|uniref:Putative alpha/beta hydrolase n=1 Tax=Aspergillus novofumigatus (strain IBT 16806) TaxID=1392255 RepID=A0A2I1BX88_ASPN1|nr:putative alpha/beta hydrolase [Aspergillus novofumigatus IBT 16806]PKX89988.1 putative alpha/beta hydrolase [Aspergillus novofumigatus IBT 16806]